MSWEEFETADERGWRRVRCAICKFTLAPTNSPLDRIFGDCPGCRRAAQCRLIAPGDALKSLIFHATAGAVFHGLGCERFRHQMNRWGWRGCLRKANRVEILKRLREQAAIEGYALTRRAIIGHLGRAAAHWLRTRARRGE